MSSTRSLVIPTKRFHSCETRFYFKRAHAECWVPMLSCPYWQSYDAAEQEKESSKFDVSRFGSFWNAIFWERHNVVLILYSVYILWLPNTGSRSKNCHILLGCKYTLELRLFAALVSLVSLTMVLGKCATKMCCALVRFSICNLRNTSFTSVMRQFPTSSWLTSHEYKRLKNELICSRLKVTTTIPVCRINYHVPVNSFNATYRIKYESQSLDDAMCRIGCPTLRHSNGDCYKVHRDVRRNVVDCTRETMVGPSLWS